MEIRENIRFVHLHHTLKIVGRGLPVVSNSRCDTGEAVRAGQVFLETPMAPPNDTFDDEKRFVDGGGDWDRIICLGVPAGDGETPGPGEPERFLVVLARPVVLGLLPERCMASMCG